MKTIIEYLRRLSCNNNREWFTEHKSEYQDALARFNAFAEQLIAEISVFDPTIQGLTVKDCTYRIYRDVRFSKDKSPYKTHMGVYVCRGGKKSGYSGYYFHIGTGDGNTYPSAHMLAVGDYCCDPKALRVLREDIMDRTDEFVATIQEEADPRFQLDEEFKLKRVPKGFDPDLPCAELLKYKVYCLYFNTDNDFITAPELAKRVASTFRTAKPFLDFVNRAIEYVKEGGE